ncbi:hypothetical protein BDK51DRAFT_43825 [Blyttiomyces helicus]|uniref:Uncharacterized protein n=1 Tax=Blyttiomyces helicus TaxID=388810 RepID=A0A4P9W2U6_9FUNG|nr:hypothetical protein BDK51DRAFT_43825 [Blyttiomyces helicus]|eukprot:RKO86571.1 hypothetical protein BDK51DRAFT_43825 [Blyttiomyces helicus]
MQRLRQRVFSTNPILAMSNLATQTCSAEALQLVHIAAHMSTVVKSSIRWFLGTTRRGWSNPWRRDVPLFNEGDEVMCAGATGSNAVLQFFYGRIFGVTHESWPMADSAVLPLAGLTEEGDRGPDYGRGLGLWGEAQKGGMWLADCLESTSVQNFSASTPTAGRDAERRKADTQRTPTPWAFLVVSRISVNPPWQLFHHLPSMPSRRTRRWEHLPTCSPVGHPSPIPQPGQVLSFSCTLNTFPMSLLAN